MRLHITAPTLHTGAASVSTKTAAVKTVRAGVFLLGTRSSPLARTTFPKLQQEQNELCPDAVSVAHRKRIAISAHSQKNV